MVVEEFIAALTFALLVGAIFFMVQR